MNEWRSLPNLSSQTLSPVKPPWKLKPGKGVPKPEVSKEDFRNWCKSKDTSHVFFTAFEGINPAARINKEDNPPQYCHALVADYDTVVSTKEVLESIKNNSPDGLKPTWLSETRSGGIRAVWEFEREIFADQPEILNRFLSELSKELKMHTLAPGLDPASLDPKMVWELGSKWVQVKDAKPLTKDFLKATEIKSAGRTVVTSEVLEIPKDVIKEALDEKYPNRWTGEFVFGSRGPLFWVDDGIQREGCMVLDHGIKAFSTRSDKGFMTWEDLFGREFVRKYEERRIGSAAEDCYYDGKSYWTRENGDRWVGKNKDDMIMSLKVKGVQHRTRKKKASTEVEEVLHSIQLNNRVDGCGPFLYNKKKIVSYGGMRLINTSNRMPMSPFEGEGDPADFPWLYEFFHKAFEDPQFDERRGSASDHFLAWLQRYWMSSLSGKPQLGQISIIAGPPGCGKTLLSTFILGQIMGGCSDAGNFLIGGSQFNKELGEVGLWNIDDGMSASSLMQHKRFTEALKAHVANPQVVYRAMYKDAVKMPWRGRIVVTCNDDAESIGIVPNLDTTIMDKISLYKFSREWKATFLDDHSMEELIKKELPHFLAWLRDWQVPEDLVNTAEPRYGLYSYHHPAIVEEARQQNQDHRLTEMLDIWIRIVKDEKMSSITDGVWEGTCTELLFELNRIEEARGIVREYNAVSLGKKLAHIKYYEPLLGTRLKKGTKRYRIKVK
jgi:hypothetical protein